MARKNSGSNAGAGSSLRRKADRRALDRLSAGEAAGVFQALLERHPELLREAEELAEAAVTDVDVDTLAEDVEEVVLAPDLEDLNARAGGKRWGYVEPTEAAWELLDEALQPFLDEMERQIELGFPLAAVRTCQGIVLGLYRCRGQGADRALDWAEDFPMETATHAVEMLARESSARHRRSWRLPERFREQIPEWADRIESATKRGPRNRSTDDEGT